MGFEELADCPVAALQGLSENAAQALKEAFGIDTVRELADNKFVRLAQAIVALSELGGGEGDLQLSWNPAESDERGGDTSAGEQDFKDFSTSPAPSMSSGAPLRVEPTTRMPLSSA